jgi:tripartite-type tricarboxylate transporter receptor subunit TctC
MTLYRRQFLQLAGATCATAAFPRLASANEYPTKPVRLVVGFPPAGGADVTARLIGQSLSERLGQQFFVDNRPGAGSNIGTEAVVRAPADGNTLLLAALANAVNATLYGKLNFNFIRDIAPVAGISREPNVMLVNSSFPTKTVPEFISYAKVNPGKINMASAGNGSPPHVIGELFKMMSGVTMAHVPYRGAAPALTDLLGGQVQVMFAGLASSIAHIKAGKLHALAVTTATRLEALADTPTVGEFLPGYEASGWQGVAAPKNTPPDIINKLNSEINSALADPKMKARLADLGLVPMPMTPSEFGKLIASETEKWSKVIRVANITAE